MTARLTDRQQLGRVLVAFGLVMLFTPVWARGYSAFEQYRLLGQIEARKPATGGPGGGALPPSERGGREGAKGPGDESSRLTSAPLAPPFLLEIPRIGLQAAVVKGVDPEDLRRGPGWYPESALPGEPGNAAVAGHRTTYGAWFRDLDRLQPGDAIFLSDGRRQFAYRVERVYSVAQDDWTPIAPTPYPALTLTTCTPPGGAEYRLIVRARQDPGEHDPGRGEVRPAPGGAGGGSVRAVRQGRARSGRA